MGFTDYLTVEGQRLIAKSISDSLPITFTRVVMGTGYMNEGDIEKNVSDVITPVVTLDVTSVTMSGNESVIISTYFKNEEIEEGFYFREKGIYLQVGTEEVLAIYGNAGSLAEYIDTAEVCIIEKMIRTVLTMSTDELENVILLDGVSADTPIPFEETEELEELVSGETLKVLFGKVAKTVKEFIKHIPTRATATILGHVKITDSSAVTDSTGLALAATEKNASIDGTLANQISKTQSLFFGGRTHMSFQGEYLLLKEIALPDEFASKDVNNFYVVVTLEQDNTQKVYTPFVQKATGCFTVFVRDIEGAFVSGQTIWFNYIVIIRH